MVYLLVSPSMECHRREIDSRPVLRFREPPEAPFPTSQQRDASNEQVLEQLLRVTGGPRDHEQIAILVAAIQAPLT